jgi:hypothetical protein
MSISYFDLFYLRSDAHSLDNLQYLLSKAELLERELNNGSYDARSKVAYANQIEERLHGQGVTKDSGQDQFRMVDDVLAGLRARRERQLLDSEEATRSLNDKRVELSEKEAEVRRKRRELQLIQSKVYIISQFQLFAFAPHFSISFSGHGLHGGARVGSCTAAELYSAEPD